MHAHGGGGGGGSFVSGHSHGWEEGGSHFDNGLVTITLLTNLTNVLPVNTAPTITACGAGGRMGPTAAMCAAAYRNSGFPTNFYQGVSNGIQQFQIQQSGIYKITAAGARGGRGTYRAGFLGADGALATISI